MAKLGEVKYLASSSHPLYKKLSGMINRCHHAREGNKSYKNYQGKGISVCYEWRHDINKDGFNNFYIWSIENGWEDGLTIDRIDPLGDYEPSNCRWVTMFEQQSNKTNNRYITHNGETKHLMEWARELNIDSGMVSERLRRGWDISDVLSPSVKNDAEFKSEISGVHWNCSRKRWKVTSSLNGMERSDFVGWYYTLENAEYAKLKYLFDGVKIHNKHITIEMLTELDDLKLRYLKDLK